MALSRAHGQNLVVGMMGYAIWQHCSGSLGPGGTEKQPETQIDRK